MKNVIVIIFLSFSIVSSSQIRFNNTYNYFYLQDSRNVICYNEGYLILGGGRDSVNSPNGIKIILKHIDSLGNEIWNKSYGDTIHNYYHGSRNSLIKNFNGGYSVVGSRHDSVNNTCLLMKFDDNFDTLWTKYYFDNPDFTALYNHVQTDDGGYALVGSNDEDDPDGDVLLIKTDSLGNMEWYRKYGYSERDIGLSIVRTPDKGFLIGGTTKYSGQNDGYLIKTDSLGNEEWTDYYGNNAYPDGSIYNIVKTMNNEYLIALSSYVTSPISPPFYNRQYSIIRLDSNFNVLWNKRLGIVAEYTGLGSIIEATNGDILASITDNHVSGLFRLSSNGDSLWKHYYSPAGSSGENALLAIKQTNDNGFIMAGVAFSPQQAWVVKTDSCGCLVAGCGCGGTGLTQIANKDSFTIYPNPAKDRIHITTGNNSSNAIILDIYGRIVKDIETINDKAIDVSFLDPGVYIIKIGAESYKFVKN